MKKGTSQLVPVALGIITLAAGVTMLFIIPELLLSVLNETGEGGLLKFGDCHAYNTSPSQCSATVAQCCILWEVHYQAQTKVDTVRNIGMAVIVIALVWIIIGVVSGAKGTK